MVCENSLIFGFSLHNHKLFFMTIDEIKKQVTESRGSLFTKDDVLSLLDDISETGNVSVEKLKDIRTKIIKTIAAQIENLDENRIVDTSNARFEISNGNEIEVEENTVSIDTDYLISEMKDIVDEAFDDEIMDIELSTRLKVPD